MPYVVKIWEPKPPGTLWATPGLLWDCFTFYVYLRFGVFRAVFLEYFGLWWCDLLSLGDWFPTFRRVLVSFSVTIFKQFQQNGSFFQAPH